MKSSPIRAALLLGLCSLPAAASAQAQANQRIQARDGDFVFVQNSDSVRVVRRREAAVRAVYEPTQNWLVVLVDYGAPGAAPDGIVDAAYRYHDVTGQWPPGQRWEGLATVDEYSFAGDFLPRGIGLTLPSGLSQVLFVQDDGAFANRTSSGILTFRTTTRGMRSTSFDVAEREEVAQASARAARGTGEVPPASTAYPATAPVRVGGNIRMPAKIYDARPVYPQEALAARVTGVVIIEATIGADGRVTDTKVLRGSRLLDAAATDAVRQWRFEPTLVNGVAVPVIMTVTVSFNLQ